MIYHNEPVSVYTDKELTNKIGTFTAKQNVNEYEVGSIILSSKQSSRNLFATTLFGSTKTTKNNTEDEIVNITKKEYEMLLSRLNKLSEIINKIK